MSFFPFWEVSSRTRNINKFLLENFFFFLVFFFVVFVVVGKSEIPRGTICFLEGRGSVIGKLDVSAILIQSVIAAKRLDNTDIHAFN